MIDLDDSDLLTDFNLFVTLRRPILAMHPDSSLRGERGAHFPDFSLEALQS